MYLANKTTKQTNERCSFKNPNQRCFFKVGNKNILVIILSISKPFNLYYIIPAGGLSGYILQERASAQHLTRSRIQLTLNFSITIAINFVLTSISGKIRILKQLKHNLCLNSFLIAPTISVTTFCLS